MSRSPDRAAILVVNGFDRGNHWGRYDTTEPSRFPWIDLCLRQIRRHTEEDEADIFVYDNSRLKTHREAMRRAGVAAVFPSDRTTSLVRPIDLVWPAMADRLLARSHARALDHLVERLPDGYRWIITLDTDSFPIRDGWVQALTSRVRRGASIVGVWRDEMKDLIRPFVHVSGLCMEIDRFRRLPFSFSTQISQDLGQNITLELLQRGERVEGLPRTNAENHHFLMAGIYGNLIYHHGAGSRRGSFWVSKEEEDEEARAHLMNRVFRDLDGLVGDLMGCPYDALPEVASIAQGTDGVSDVFQTSVRVPCDVGAEEVT